MAESSFRPLMTALCPTTTIFRTRSPSPRRPRSPDRRNQFPSVDLDPLLSNLSPQSTLKALSATTAVPSDRLDPSNALATSIANVSTVERAFGIKAALAAQKLREWYTEVLTWDWPSDQDASLGKGFFSSHAASEDSLTANEAQNPYIGYLSIEAIAHYERRIEDIRDNIDALDVEVLKEHVLNVHIASRSRPISSQSAAQIEMKPLSYVQLSDFTTIITATILQALPILSRLNSLLSTWDIRLSVLRQIPSLLHQLKEVRLAIDTALIRLSMGMLPDNNDWPFSQDLLAIARQKLERKVTSLGRQIDRILDELEGRSDSLPESWIDDMEKIEADFATWIAQVQNISLKNDWQLPVSPSESQQTLLPEPSFTSNNDTFLPSQTPTTALSPAQNFAVESPANLPFISPAKFAQSSTPRQVQNLPSNTSSSAEARINVDIRPVIQLDNDNLRSQMAENQNFLTTTPQMEVQQASPISQPPKTNEGKPFETLASIEKRCPRSIKGGLVSPLLASPPLKARVNGTQTSYAPENPVPADSPQSVVRLNGQHHKIENSYLPDRKLIATPPTVSHFAEGHQEKCSSSADHRIDIVFPMRTDYVTSSPHGSLPKSTCQEFANELSAPRNLPKNFINQLPCEESIDRPLTSRSSRDSYSLTEESCCGMGSDDLSSIPHGSPNFISSPPDSTTSVHETPSPPCPGSPCIPDPDDIFIPPDSPNASISSPASMLISSTPYLMRCKSPEDQLEEKISSILTTIPARIRLGHTPVTNSSKPAVDHHPQTVPRSSQGRPRPSVPPRPVTPTPTLTLTPAYDRHKRRHARSENENPVRLYHLYRGEKQPPLKLFVRAVGEEGERVMVRVGGGWADLAEYLREYVMHHGRRRMSESKLEVQEIPTNSPHRSPGRIPDTGRTTPISRPSSAFDIRPSPPLAIRKTRQPNTSSAPRPSLTVANVEKASRAAGGSLLFPRRRLSVSSSTSIFSNSTPLGLAGPTPKSRNISMSPESEAWVEDMMGQARKTSATLRSKLSTGSLRGYRPSPMAEPIPQLKGRLDPNTRRVSDFASHPSSGGGPSNKRVFLKGLNKGKA
ncbi:hypothetical protein LOZ66_000915 [Ophidiomyces ophidiicola]|nr:hypothetical protein LOZ66_000915 [Ophidiomyces ophidiicola]